MSAKKEDVSEILKDIPPPPEGSVFSLQKVEDIFLPHPYTIGPGHVAMASEKFSGRLGVDAIEASERSGHGCRYPGCCLKYSEHEKQRTLFVLLDEKPPRNLWTVPGLQAYLLAIKERAESMGVQGFAFPHKA